MIRTERALALQQTAGTDRPGVPQQRAHAVVATDASGLIVYWDDDAQRLHGFTPGQVVGTWKVGDLFGPPLDGVTGTRDLLGQLQALAPAPAVWAGQVQCRHASGSWFTSDVVVTPYRPDDDAPAGIALICRPVSDQPPSADAPQASPAGARPGPPGPAVTALGADVTSKLGHELRSPLASITGLTGVMLMRLAAGQADAATQARQLEMIRASADRSLAVIERVADLAKIESGRVQPSPRLIDCRHVVADVAEELQSAAAERGLRVRPDVPSHPVTVTSDPGMLGQLLRELAGNGLRFTDAGEVRIVLHADGGLVTIDVSDDGPGIPADEQARVFEPFERGTNAAERDDGAPGLGLHLAREQAGLLGGQLTLRSQAGSGSTFTVTLADPHAQAAAGSGTDSGS